MSWSEGTPWEREPKGRNCQELLIAPKPDKSPRTIVPITMSRERAAVAVSEGSSASGMGIYESAKRYNVTGMRLKIARGPKKVLADHSSRKI